MCSALAILALVIACVGLYGAVSYNVARRTGEIGIRIALGAQRGGVVRMILREVLVLVAGGQAIGMATALGRSTFVASFLYGMKANDPLTFAGSDDSVGRHTRSRIRACAEGVPNRADDRVAARVRSVACSRRYGRARRPGQGATGAATGYAGLMFWLTRNRLPGSYFRFTWARRGWLSRYAAFTLSSPSSIIMLMYPPPDEKGCRASQ